ncbi:MAG: LPS export ABC transporter ATP-binding protein [Elusimicrobia bacterium RIFOXYA12_FULL_51_18]|nr:MAG: LPS export ABC transporter ATP-binding protein [Elusimicrobia bacterium RIFOXYA12_FULL_51_18]OGS29949.1 MAG: LPS export ABC transporter ATP-binding protein [Elusimicrobia bacterium RIFOXYA2_FULL_53_38]
MRLTSELLEKSFNRRKVVNGISLTINSGEICGLLGPNGAGKTTTFHMLVGFMEPDSGKVFMDSKDVSGMPMYLRARGGIGYLAQEPTVFRGLTVEDNLVAILERTTEDKTVLRNRVESLLNEFGLMKLKNQKAWSLSGGEKRRLEVARVMINEPRIILLDEPFVGIDPITVSELKKIIRHLKDKGIGVLITDHNVRETLSITDRSYLIYNGQILIEGSADVLLNDPKAREYYLGWDFKM